MERKCLRNPAISSSKFEGAASESGDLRIATEGITSRTATTSARSWHSTAELLPRSCVFRYLTVRQEFTRFRGLSIPSRKSIQTMGSDRKMDSKTDSKPAGETDARNVRSTDVSHLFPSHSHDIINISQSARVGCSRTVVTISSGITPRNDPSGTNVLGRVAEREGPYRTRS